MVEDAYVVVFSNNYKYVGTFRAKSKEDAIEQASHGHAWERHILKVVEVIPVAEPIPELSEEEIYEL